MRKTAIPLILALILILSAPAISDNPHTSFKLDSAEATAGTVVKIPLSITSDIASSYDLVAEIEYDSFNLEFIGIEKEGCLTASSWKSFPTVKRDEELVQYVQYGNYDSTLNTAFETLQYYLGFSASSAQVYNGKVCLLCFKISDTAPAGKYNVTLKLRDNKADYPKDELGEWQYQTESTITVTEPSPSHTHNLVFREEKEASCSSYGHYEYWECTLCGEKFQDSSAANIEESYLMTPDSERHEHRTILSSDDWKNVSLEYINAVCRDCGKLHRFSVPASDYYYSGVFCADCGKYLGTTERLAGSFENPFTDLSPSHRFYNSVIELCARGFFNGVSSDSFAPENTMTRAMFVTVLGRCYKSVGLYTPSTTSSFSDVKDGTWYSEYVYWAEANGIVNGFKDGTFRPNAPITREQAVTILFRMTGFEHYITDMYEYGENTENLNSWSRSAILWGVDNGVYPLDGNMINPGESATRSFVAEILWKSIALKYIF